MHQDELELTREMAQAIRDVVNFSRFDEKYQALSRLERPNAVRSEYFESKLADIASDNQVDTEELRDWLKHYLRPDSFGLEAREYKGEEYVVKM
ncbi:hypothetical protein G6L37_04535 [Agrobacterium rubi]|nr:hypothetical protein [Agrobacterium rubi]NTF24620.1 hypothetical protein [Agrobacterium rubi]